MSYLVVFRHCTSVYKKNCRNQLIHENINISRAKHKMVV